jgi:hypothetical protein
MAYDYCPFGIYHGWTRDEILAQLKVVDAAIKSRSAGSGQVQSASLNGKSISFFQDGTGGEAGGLSALRSEKHELMLALSSVDDDYNEVTDRATASFRCP